MIVDELLQARGVHPTRIWQKRDWETWLGWYATVSYHLFGLLAWPHFKRLLLYPGESVHNLPTRNILAIGWHSKTPEIPDYIRIKREDHKDCTAEIFIKSYEQGAGAFQSGTVDNLASDEEGADGINTECKLRVLDRDGNMSYAATPILGANYLGELRSRATSAPKSVFHVRLPTKDNPSLSAEALAEIVADLHGHPELMRLRLEGYPLAMEGLVYKDTYFTSAHFCEPFDIPRDWCRWRSLDHGWRTTACGFYAMSPDEGTIVRYDEYVGQEQTIEQNVRGILEASGATKFVDTFIDPATLGTDAHTGKRVIDLYDEAGLSCTPAPVNAVVAGIGVVWALLAQKGGQNKDRPRFRVVRDRCPRFIWERERYKWPDAREKGDDKAEKPVKKNDHCMDEFRYFVNSAPRWRPPPAAPPPEPGTLAFKFWQKRQPKTKSRL